MLKNLLNWFGPKKSEDIIKCCPEIQGHVTLQLIDQRGKVCKESTGFNIWTLTGREYLSELIALQAFSTIEANRGLVRNDRVAYIGLGTGSQEEVATVSSLVNPISTAGTTNSGTFLSQLDTPAVFPVLSAGSSITAVQFAKTFGQNDFSTSSVPAVVLTEAGLFTDGNPLDNFSIGTNPNMTDWTESSGFSPVAYKTFEPITKTQDFTLRIVWEVRFL